MLACRGFFFDGLRKYPFFAERTIYQPVIYYKYDLLLLKILFLFMLTNLFVFAEDIQKNREREAARSVIMRTVPSLAKAPEKLQLEIIEKEDGHDVFETKASGGILNIRGSSGTALCRGFYDF